MILNPINRRLNLLVLHLFSIQIPLYIKIKNEYEILQQINWLIF